MTEKIPAWNDKPRYCSCSRMIISGQAFTLYTCASCLKDIEHSNTRTPRICESCSKRKKYANRCPYCLGLKKPLLGDRK